MAQGFCVSPREVDGSFSALGFASGSVPTIRAAKPVGWQPQATVGWAIPAHRQMLGWPSRSLVGANTIMVKDLARVD